MIRIHMTEDEIKEHIADRLAAALSDIQKRFASTEHLFVVGEVCAEHGIEIRNEAAA